MRLSEMKTCSKFKSDALLYGLILIASCFFLLIYSQAASPLYGVQGVDANIFKIMGTGICQGKLPYAEMFDHKGPVLFYIYALACAFSNAKFGLFLIELAFMYVTMLMQYRIARLYLGRVKSAVVLAVSLIFIAITIDDGGQTEFFEITFAYISLYYLLRFYKTRDLGAVVKVSAIMGLCFAMAALMRLNDGCLIVGVPYFFLVCWLIKEKQWVPAFKSVGAFTAATTAICLPLAIYFLCKGIFADMWYGMITFNFHYAGLSYIQNRMLKTLVVTLFAVCAFCTLRRGRDNTVPIYVIIPVVLFSTIGIGNNAYGHYFMILAPTLGLISIWLYDKRYLAVMLWILMVGGWNMGGTKGMWGSLIYCTYQDVKEMSESSYKRSLTAEGIKLLQAVPAEERASKIWAYNLNHTLIWDIFTSTHSTPANTYFVHAHKDYDPSIREKEDIKLSTPQWVLVQCKDILPVDSLYFQAHYDSIGAVANDYYNIKLLKRK